MAKKSQELTAELFEKINKIRLNEAAGIFGTTSDQTVLQELRGAMAQFSKTLNTTSDYETTMKDYEALAAGLDTAGITGLISEPEMIVYYELLDNLWAALEHEKAPPDS